MALRVRSSSISFRQIVQHSDAMDHNGLNNSTTTFGAIAMMLTCMKNAQMKKLIVAVRVRTLPMTMTMTMKEPPGFVASISSLRMLYV
jgi:hypothetical protein